MRIPHRALPGPAAAPTRVCRGPRRGLKLARVAAPDVNAEDWMPVAHLRLGPPHLRSGGRGQSGSAERTSEPPLNKTFDMHSEGRVGRHSTCIVRVERVAGPVRLPQRWPRAARASRAAQGPGASRDGDQRVKKAIRRDYVVQEQRVVPEHAEPARSKRRRRPPAVVVLQHLCVRFGRCSDVSWAAPCDGRGGTERSRDPLVRRTQTTIAAARAHFSLRRSGEPTGEEGLKVA